MYRVVYSRGFYFNCGECFIIEQCNYHGINEVFFLSWPFEAITSDSTVAIFKVKKKGGVK